MAPSLERTLASVHNVDVGHCVQVSNEKFKIVIQGLKIDDFHEEQLAEVAALADACKKCTPHCISLRAQLILDWLPADNANVINYSDFADM